MTIVSSRFRIVCGTDVSIEDHHERDSGSHPYQGSGCQAYDG
jgi:hypothetical protein